MRNKFAINCALILNIFLLVIVWFCYFEPYFGRRRCPENCKSCESRTIKIRLRTIGTVIAMHYTEGGDNSYPQNPGEFEFWPELINNADETTWESLNIKSPYYFLCNEDSIYTGASQKVIAISKDAHYLQNLYFILYEDGHTETVELDDALKIYFPQCMQIMNIW